MMIVAASISPNAWSDYNVLAMVLGERSPATSNLTDGHLHSQKYQQRLQTLPCSFTPKNGMQSCKSLFGGVKSCARFRFDVNFRGN